MRLRLLFPVIASLAVCGGSGLADSPALPTPIHELTGNDPQTEQSEFTVPDAWELRWTSPRLINISVLGADGTPVVGTAGISGVIYVAKGGTFHLQVDCHRLADLLPSRNPDGTTRNWIPPEEQARMSRPYDIQVVLQSSALMTPAPPEHAMPNYNLPGHGLANSSGPGYTAPLPGSPTTTPASMTGMPTPAPAPLNNAPSQVSSVSLTADQARAVVLIKGDKGEGTGFLVKMKDGPVVITNQHVIANNPNLKITTSNGLDIVPLSFKAATDRDLAMIVIKDAGYSYLTLATDVTTVSPGDPVVTPGNSEGGEVMLNTNGKVLALGPDRIEIDNPIYHGNSGGPVYDGKTNQVIGVVTEAMKVDTSDELDKASFSSRSSAIQNSMRYFAMRVDNVPQWEDIDWRGYQGETAFLEKFDQRSRCLDSFLNAPTPSAGQTQTTEETEAANLWKQDDALVKANNQFEDQSGEGVASGQNLDALHELFGSIVDLANDDVTNIKNPNNFYLYDRQRAKEEMEYRQAIRDELDRINSNISRLGDLPRK